MFDDGDDRFVPSAGNYLPQQHSPELIEAARSLTIKQRLFVEEYLISFSPSKAAKAAGYSPNAGRTLLTKPYIAVAIEESIEARLRRTRVTQDDVLNELCKLGFSNMGDYVKESSCGDAVLDLTTATPDQLAAIKKFKTKRATEGRGDAAEEVLHTEFELYDKTTALKAVGEHLGMFKKTVEVGGIGGGPIQINVNVTSVPSGKFLAPENIIDGELVTNTAQQALASALAVDA